MTCQVSMKFDATSPSFYILTSVISTTEIVGRHQELLVIKHTAEQMLDLDLDVRVLDNILF